MTVECHLVPHDPVSREEKGRGLRVLLLRGAIRLAQQQAAEGQVEDCPEVKVVHG